MSETYTTGGLGDRRPLYELILLDPNTTEAEVEEAREALRQATQRQIEKGRGR